MAVDTIFFCIIRATSVAISDLPLPDSPAIQIAFFALTEFNLSSIKLATVFAAPLWCRSMNILSPNIITVIFQEDWLCFTAIRKNFFDVSFDMLINKKEIDNLKDIVQQIIHEL